VIGLVGGVGCGKSHLARLLHEKLPIEIVEGDKAGHQVLTEPHVEEQLRQAFGAGVLTAEGEINRRQIGRLVFGSGPQQRAARKKLEQIVHPRISEILARQVALAQSRPNVVAVILDAAILLEAGWRHICDAVVFIDTPLETRVERVTKSRGWSRDELQLREESQFPLERKRKEADYVVDNSGDEQVALSQLEAAFSRVVSPNRS
jgi:dephospho-CoA kinase